MKKLLIFAAIASTLISAVPPLADGIQKFGNNCIGNFGKSTYICISSNGSFVSSSYTFRGSISTKGTHKGCSAKGDTIVCTGVVYKTNQGNGDLTLQIPRYSAPQFRELVASLFGDDVAP